MKIQLTKPSDYSQIHQLNASAVPHVNELSLAEIEILAQKVEWLLTATGEEEKICGFLFAMNELSDYQSPNYQFFKQNYSRFCYVDRIVIGEPFRGQGLGSLLYEHLMEALGNSCPVISCEVNLLPANPDSLAFHQRLGFEGVGEQETENGKKRVLLMAKSVH